MRSETDKTASRDWIISRSCWAILIEDHVRFDDEHKRLLTAPVVMIDRVDKLAGRMDQLAVTMQQLAEAQKHTDESMNALVEAQKHTGERMIALITVVDDLIRKRP